MKKWFYFVLIGVGLFLIANYASVWEMIINFPVDWYICFFAGTVALVIADCLASKNNDFILKEKIKLLDFISRHKLSETDLDDDEFDDDDEKPD